MAKKIKSTNCVQTTCLKFSTCAVSIKNENYIEGMVLTPDCFVEQIKIKIEPPKFLK